MMVNLYFVACSKLAEPQDLNAVSFAELNLTICFCP